MNSFLQLQLEYLQKILQRNEILDFNFVFEYES